MDDEAGSHGTRCAGIAAAKTNNAEGIAGVCPGCKIMPVKACDAGGACLSTRVNPAVLYAVNSGADVIAMSFRDTNPSFLLQSVLDTAEEDGVILVAAVGNDQSQTPVYPAAYSEVTAVGGTDDDDVGYFKSNYGDWVDVAAPAQIIYSTIRVSQGSYFYGSGTSFAAPQVAGEAGLILSKAPSLTKTQVEQIIRDNVDPYTPYQGRYIGTGRINLEKALKAFCSDGTMAGDCSSTGPYRCVGGQLVYDAACDFSGVTSDRRGADINAVLMDNSPDPFSVVTEFRYELYQPCHVVMRIYDVSGRALRTLIDGRIEAGSHVVSWDGREDTGRPVSSGIYFCRLEAGGTAQTRKMILAG